MKDYRNEREYALEPFGGCACTAGKTYCDCVSDLPSGYEPEERPMFASTPIASLAVAVALTLGAVGVGWVLAAEWFAPQIVALVKGPR